MGQLLYSQPNITRENLAFLSTPEALGRFHQPYSFDAYITDIEEALDIQGLKVANSEFETTHDNNRLFGVMEVQPKEGELITSDEWKVLIGLRGSHDQAIPRGISIGSQVMVCSNLCFGGNISEMHTKQTLNIGQRLPTLINQAISKVPEMALIQEKKFEAYKQLELTTTQGDAALTRLFRRGALSSSQLARAIKEWDEPKFDEHCKYDAGNKIRSGWRLFNAVTEVQKPTGQTHNNETIRKRTEILTNYMDSWVNKTGLLAA